MYLTYITSPPPIPTKHVVIIDREFMIRERVIQKSFTETWDI